MSRKRKALVVSSAFFLLAQWLIFSYGGGGTKLTLSLLFFLLAFIWIEKGHLQFKIIFRHTLPLIILLGIFSFLLFEQTLILQETMSVFTAFCFYLFYSRSEIPLPEKASRQVTYFWLDLSILLAIYLISLAVYQLVFFASLPLWVLILCLGLLGGAVFGYGLWARRVDKKILWVYLMLFVLIIVEVFAILSFWREAFPLYKALILALLYYLYMGLLDFKLGGERLKNRYLGYLIFAIIIFILIIFSVDWRTFQ
jgi:hypothetical protein